DGIVEGVDGCEHRLPLEAGAARHLGDHGAAMTSTAGSANARIAPSNVAIRRSARVQRRQSRLRSLRMDVPAISSRPLGAADAAAPAAQQPFGVLVEPFLGDHLAL